ncbi:bifunctional DNA-binding transcriptional regulator/O6-methylguanine-DNA methyltransferase Ada [Fimbriiglobus ruber]|nr:bifunctional DNA-binding transcriptional regulator/O6-methylguanine-DNA methyltransferase Ada [Fimbriiglobus ruber]
MITKPIQSRRPGATRKATIANFDDDESRWQAVVRRDQSADGVFYYSVRTTGVYCRPSCASRRAKRENVRFHATREEAERAGFRPCKRCQPNDRSLAERHQDAVTRACHVIEAAAETPDLSELADAVGLSRFHFHRVFKMITGVTPKAYAAAHRAQRVRDDLTQGTSVTEAIYGAGYQSSGRFYATSDEQLGMTPTEYRAGGADATIRFAVGESSLGSILVAATEKGVCAIFLGDDPDALARELQDRFPNAKIVAGDGGFDQWVARVVGSVENPSLGFDLPLDIRGTAFQVRVWEALRQIPLGSTATYTEIAKRIGRPTAARAVARACGANPIAVAIPCHRVIRTDESLSGYRWGVERKAELLRREQAAD